MKAQYDRLAHLYDDFLFLPNEKVYLDYLTTFLQKNCITKPKNTILEIGCGTGNRLISLEEHHECVGIDISSDMLNQARQKLHNTQLLQMDFTDFNLHKKFDIILCLFDTLNHTKDIGSVFNSVKAHMDLNSIFIFDYYTQYGLKKNMEYNTENLSIHQTNGTSFEWLMNIHENTFRIEEFVIPVKDLFRLINENFDFEIFNQNFKKLNPAHLLSDSDIANYHIERILTVCSLR